MPMPKVSGMSAGAMGVGLALTLFGGVALAQPSGGQSGPPPAQTAPQSNIEVDDKELSKFSSVVKALQQIKQSYSDQLGQAGDKEKAQQIQTKMQQDMRQAIKDEGLSVERYSKIGQAIQNDPELKNRVKQVIQKQ